MRRKNLNPKVFFNASVILAGLHVPSGGSGKLLSFVKQKRITGIISEIVLDETLRHAEKIGLTKTSVGKRVRTLFSPNYPAPKHTSVKKFLHTVLDQGDAHVLASSRETESDFLVTLDKKHLLVLRNKIKGLKIVTPKDLLERLAEK